MTLTDIISQEIKNSGNVMSFARFMQLALYAPELGYYNASRHILGPQGDFVTAPEISPLFASCLAKQCQQILSSLSNSSILEIGAGSGILAKNLILELQRNNSLPKNYFIWEISEALRIQQQQLLKTHCPNYYSQIIWLTELSTDTFSGVIIANEVIDALPFHCFVKTAAGMRERAVTLINNQFSWIEISPLSPTLSEKLQILDNEFHFTPGYTSEINLAVETWLASLANTLDKGIILLFDYGYGRREYYRPDRNMGTLMCFQQHAKHDNPLLSPGQQDITAHVDFTRVIENAENNSLQLKGFTTQAAFLMATGILEPADSAMAPLDQYQQAQGIKTLLLPGEMGEIVKVMALGKNFADSLIGFTMSNRGRDL